MPHGISAAEGWPWNERVFVAERSGTAMQLFLLVPRRTAGGPAVATFRHVSKLAQKLRQRPDSSQRQFLGDVVSE